MADLLTGGAALVENGASAESSSAFASSLPLIAADGYDNGGGDDDDAKGVDMDERHDSFAFILKAAEAETGASSLPSSPLHGTNGHAGGEGGSSSTEMANAATSALYSIDDDEDALFRTSSPPTVRDVDPDGASTTTSFVSVHNGETESGLLYDDNAAAGGTGQEKAPPPPPPPPEAAIGGYHPEFMFCGECTSCAPPPPPLPTMTATTTTAAPSRKRHARLRRHECADPNCAVPSSSSRSGGVDAVAVALDDNEAFDSEAFDNDASRDGIELSSVSRSSSFVREPPQKHRSIVRVSNLTCPSHVLVINSIVQPLPGVSKVLTNLDHPDPDQRQLVKLDHDPFITPLADVVHALRAMGYDAVPERDGGKELLVDTSGDRAGGGGGAAAAAGSSSSSTPAVSPHGRCRTQLYVEGICCASEIPAINGILKPLRGIMKVSINITTRIVYVDHDPFVIGASSLADALNRERFGATVKKDGAAYLRRRMEEEEDKARRAAAGGVGRSAFVLLTLDLITQADVPVIQSVLKQVDGVRRIGINLEQNAVYVDHDTRICPAELILSALTNGGYPSQLFKNAADEFKDEAVKPKESMPSKYVESTLVVPGMSTLRHVKSIQKAFRQNFLKSHVRAHYPHVPSRTIKVEHNPHLLSARRCAEVLMRSTGLDDVAVSVDGAVENLALPLAEEYGDGGGPMAAGKEHDDDLDEEFAKGLHCNVIWSGIFWVVSMLSIVGGSWEKLKYAGLLSVVFGIPPVARKAWRTIRRWEFDANCMMVVAAFGAVALQEYDEAASVAFLFAVSEWLEARATRKARRALGAIVSLRPDHANVIDPETNDIVIVPASNVAVGSLVSVRTGDKVPADGVVVEGTSAVDESSLTGEARPVSKRAGDAVSGGVINIGSTQLVVRTTSTVDDSAVSRLIRLVEEAQANRSPTEKIVDAFARKYTPVVVLLAAFMCTVPWFFGRETGRYWTLNGLIIIVIACPCALTISTPVTYAAGLAATAQRGVIVKGGSRLEALGNVKTVVFDKTGTLTEGKFTLIHLDVVEGRRSRQELLEVLAVVEAPSSHPLSATLVDAAKKEGVGIPKNKPIRDHTILKGEGVMGHWGDETIYVGNERLFQRLGMYSGLASEYTLSAKEWSRGGGTVGFVGIDGVGIIGMFCVSDAVREEARGVVMALQDDDVEVLMLTGDGDGAAKAVGKEVGLPDSCIRSQLLPEDKLHFVGSIKGPVTRKYPKPCGNKELILMVGDGVNDAPALAVSDVGVAMGEGAALAMEMSDVTLMDSNLSKLLYSMKMGSRVIRTIQENIIFSLVAKLAVVGLTFAGKMTLLWAIASDVGVMLIVTLNGMKLLPGRASLNLAQEQLPRTKRSYNELPLAGQPTSVPDIV